MYVYSIVILFFCSPANINYMKYSIKTCILGVEKMEKLQPIIVIHNKIVGFSKGTTFHSKINM